MKKAFIAFLAGVSVAAATLVLGSVAHAFDVAEDQAILTSGQTEELYAKKGAYGQAKFSGRTSTSKPPPKKK